MEAQADLRLLEAPLLSSAEVSASPCPVPAATGVYGWWFSEIPDGVPIDGCERREDWVLLYVGISPKAPPGNGKPPSSQTVRSRVRYHYRGNAEGSTLRLTLGVLLRLELRRVGSGSRRTFSTSEEVLSSWMAANARVNFVEHEEPWVLEEDLIGRLCLPLNLDQNKKHPFHQTLSAMRKAARLAAESLPVLDR